MKPSSAKAKGRRLQNKVAEDIRTLPGLEEEDVKPAIMGESGMDIHLSPKARAIFPFAVECKNVERLNICKAYDQACGNADSGLLLPVVVHTKNGRGILATMAWEDLLFIYGNVRDLIAQIEHLKHELDGHGWTVG